MEFKSKNNNIYIYMIFVGDTHGSLTNFLFECKKFNIKDIDVIHLGDFGVGFTLNGKTNVDSFDYANEELKNSNIRMYVVRGNHDNPRYWSGNQIFSNIHFIPDYSVLNIENKNILFLGGAISLDRSIRTSNVSWWANENFILDERKLNEYEFIDIVASHSAPIFTPPNINGCIVNEWVAKDGAGLRWELLAERDALCRAYDILINNGNNITHWFFGHFHQTITHQEEDTLFKGLDINEIYKLRV